MPASRAAGSAQFQNEVLPQELDYIEDRRDAVFGGEKPGEPYELPAPPDRQLLGLAFSGGGIRSATFNLGVLQALHRHGVFKFVDYLSTVSGGGFLGCALSTLLRQSSAASDGEPGRTEFPFEFSETEEEIPAVSYLRNNSNYLAPGGLLDYLRIFAVLVRGILLNFLVLLPFLLMSSMIVTMVYGQALLERLQRDDNLAEVTDLIERNWVGLKSDEPVEEFLTALDLRGMIDSQAGMTRGYVAEWLRGDEKRGGQTGLKALPPLIKGVGEDDDYGSYRFLEGVSRKQIVERLWDSGTLRNLDALREIDSVEQAVRASSVWLSSSQRVPPGAPLGVGNLYDTLADLGALERRATPARVLEVLRSTASAEALIARKEPLPEAASGEQLAAWQAAGKKLSEWQAAGRKPNLRRILQELYVRGLYNPLWLERRRNKSRTGMAVPALGYWKPYELATIEEALRGSRPVAADRDRILQSDLLSGDRGDLAQLLSDAERHANQSVTDWTAPAWHRFVNELWDGGLVDEAELKRRVDRHLEDQRRADRLGEQRQEEIALVELAVRESKLWEPSSERPKGDKKINLGTLYQTLTDIGVLHRAATPETAAPEAATPGRVLEVLQGASKSEELILRTQGVDDAFGKEVGVEELLAWRAAGKKPNLRRILLELYDRGLYDPEWLERRRQRDWAIDAIERAIRASKVWKPSSERPVGDKKINLGTLYDTLADVGALEEGATPARVLEVLVGDQIGQVGREAEELFGEGRPEALIDRKEPKPGPEDAAGLAAWQEAGQDLSAWRAAGRKPNLRRILHKLWQPDTGSAPLIKATGSLPDQKLGYRERYDLAVLEALFQWPVDGSPRRERILQLLEERWREVEQPLGENREKAEQLIGENREMVGLLLDHYEEEFGEQLEEWTDATWQSFVLALRDEGRLLDPADPEARDARTGPGGVFGFAERIQAWLTRNDDGTVLHVLAYGGQQETSRVAAAAGGSDRPWSPYEHPFRATLALLLIGLVWVLLYPLLLLLARSPAIRRIANRKGVPWWRDFYEKSFSLLLVVIVAVAFIEFQPYLVYHYRHLLGSGLWWPLGIGAISLIVSMIAGPAIAYLRGIGRAVMLALVALVGPALPLLVYVHMVLFAIYQQGLWSGYYTLDRPLLAAFFIGAAAVVHFFNLPIDVNSTSLHGFYRDRLSTAYLMRRRADGAVVRGDDVRLDQICDSRSGAPYHLINATLNLQGTKDPTLRRRRGDFFQFSKHFVGSKHTGYCRTQDLQEVFPHLHVSSAMAVSAAAAAPNMGTFTSGPLVVLMALLNIRLGYWLPNPRRVNRWLPAAGSALGTIRLLAASLVGSFRARPGAYQLLKEMLSVMRADLPLVNLSDGGHMENTGVYQLLRRRCQFIIVGDAEADPEMRFSALAALIRYARIDLGIEIDIHVDDLRLDQEGESRQHCALGTIRYPAMPAADDRAESTPPEVGYLLYIKASITGDEGQVVSEQHRKSPLFPHESTADQFFDEGQFEAYRDLGYHICSGLFDELHKDQVEKLSDCTDWFETLRISLSPGLASLVGSGEVQSALGDIERMLREPRYKRYFYEIYPEFEPVDRHRESLDAEEEAEEFRNVFHLVNAQLQLMESLFVSFEFAQPANRSHPANRGRMNLFRRWAKAPSFKRAYLASVTNYSAPFQQFCQTALGLTLEMQWQRLTARRHAELAGRAEEIGLESLKAPLPDEGEALILTTLLEGAEPILIAESVVTLQAGKLRVLSLDMRAGYQGSGMRTRAMIALKDWAQEEGFLFSRSEAASVAVQDEELEHSSIHRAAAPDPEQPPGSSRP